MPCSSRRARCGSRRCERENTRSSRSWRPLERSERESVDRFTHGTTIATNALLERRGARTAFVGTTGFEHVLHLRRQPRAHLLPAVRRASGASRSARALGRRARSHRAGRRAGAARARDASRARRTGDRRLPPLRVQGQPPREGGSDRATASLPGCPRRRLPRGRARVPRVRARRPRRWTRISVPSWPDICTRCRMPARKRVSCRRS